MNITLSTKAIEHLMHIRRSGRYASVDAIVEASLQMLSERITPCDSAISSLSDELSPKDLPGELWEPIPEFTHYEASTCGRIRSLRFDKIKIMKPAIIQRNYRQVNLSFGTGHKHYLVHRLIASTFLPNPNSKQEVNHRDGNKANNQVANLEWISNQENITHAVNSGIRGQGERHHRSKLTEQDVRWIYAAHSKGSETAQQLADRFAVSVVQIRNILRGTSWSHLSNDTT